MPRSGSWRSPLAFRRLPSVCLYAPGSLAYPWPAVDRDDGPPAAGRVDAVAAGAGGTRLVRRRPRRVTWPLSTYPLVPGRIATLATVLSVAVVREEGVATAGTLVAVGGAVLVVEFVSCHLCFLRFLDVFGLGLVAVGRDLVPFEHVVLLDVLCVLG
jgi:hypothetical protein